MVLSKHVVGRLRSLPCTGLYRTFYTTRENNHEFVCRLVGRWDKMGAGGTATSATVFKRTYTLPHPTRERPSLRNVRLPSTCLLQAQQKPCRCWWEFKKCLLLTSEENVVDHTTKIDLSRLVETAATRKTRERSHDRGKCPANENKAKTIIIAYGLKPCWHTPPSLVTEAHPVTNLSKNRLLQRKVKQIHTRKQGGNRKTGKNNTHGELYSGTYATTLPHTKSVFLREN